MNIRESPREVTVAPEIINTITANRFGHFIVRRALLSH